MYHIGVDFGGTNIAAGIVDEKGKLLIKRSTKTKRYRPLNEIMGDLLSLCDEIMERSKINPQEVSTIGLGIPGNIHPDGKRVVYGNNIDCLTNANIEKIIKNHYPHMEVYLENDANAAALAEVFCGVARGLRNVVMVTLGTGVGGGIIIDGKIYTGANFAGGEIGHIVIEKNGEKCTCGRQGCWEQYASVTALLRQTADAIDSYPESKIYDLIDGKKIKISGRTAFDAMRMGDECGKEIVSKYVEYIGIGVVDMINILQPEMVVIGGGISKEGDNIILPLREYVKKNVYAGEVDSIPQTKIVAATMGNDAGIVGAALLYKQK
ncbi:MAG: ROK family protein [Clostridia bacterium]|nr:ROK family protein [Clostridia bacterium]